MCLRETSRNLARRLQPGEHNREAPQALTLASMNTWLQRAARIRIQQPKSKTKNKLYALHAPEVECLNRKKHRIELPAAHRITPAWHLRHGTVRSVSAGGRLTE